MIPDFENAAATRRWQQYFAEIDRLLAKAGDDLGGMRHELEAHLSDSFATSQNSGHGELERLNAAIGRLGRPADYLHPLIADDLLERGTRSYHPAIIARGLGHGLLAGSTRALIAAVFGIGYLLLAIFVAMAVLKPLWGNHVGLFRRTDGTTIFGIVSDRAGGQELLGLWAIPIALLLAGILYVALTNALRALRKRS
ncbi:hypothetical protein EAH79_16860 [Sphingomonas koreensis]|nr:hypothetical protein EAH79_16860 [Sphingomonas koreensis]